MCGSAANSLVNTSQREDLETDLDKEEKKITSGNYYIVKLIIEERRIICDIT